MKMIILRISEYEEYKRRGEKKNFGGAKTTAVLRQQIKK